MGANAKTGIESLKAPTGYKEANIVVIEKYSNKKLDTRWIGANYGPRKGFNDYVRKTGLKMGQLKTKDTVFIADGAPYNWEIQMNNFPDAVSILDFYHATEHLSDFCDLFSCKKYGKRKYTVWYDMLYDGEISGLVEGSCKLVIKKRFKGNGMRWKKRDNKQVL